MEYETLEGRHLRYEVLKTGPMGVTTRVTVHESGRIWGEPATREDGVDFDPVSREAERRQATRHVRSETVKAAGRTWETTVYENRWTDEDIPYVRRTWVHQRAPFLGIVRMELYGADRLEAQLVLVDFGRSHR